MLKTNSRHDFSSPCIVKVTGPPNRAKALVEEIEELFIASRTSGFITERDGSRVHIFLLVIGRR